MENIDKITQIITTKCEGKKAKFAQKIGIAESTLYSWLTRNTIDVVAIAQAFPDISLDWLVNNEGPMLKSEAESNEFELSEPTPTYNHVERMVTVPASVIADYRQQLENKDAQIAILLTLIKK